MTETNWIKLERFPKYEINSQADVRNRRTKREVSPTLSRKKDELEIKLLDARGHSKQICLKRLVAEAFLGGPHDDCDVIYIDGNRENLCPDNLKWEERQR